MKRIKMKSIAFVIKTPNLDYDDRVRKEALTLAKFFRVKIFVLLQENEEAEGITSYGIPYQSFCLRSRKLFPSARMISLKALEFFYRVNRELATYDVVWAHNEDMFLFSCFSRKADVLWDLHEIPTRFLRNGISRWFFRKIESNCRRIIHANEFRIKYLHDVGLIQDRNKHLVVRNYPDEEFIRSSGEDQGFASFRSWVGGASYVYLQGLQSEFRFPEETIGAVLGTPGLKIVVVGGVSPAVKQRLVAQFGQELEERVYFCGMVDQLKIPAYIRGAQFSMVFYETSRPNNRFCEPNRMYQSIVLGKPVIVGCNEPMKSLVDKYGFGIVLQGDGSNLEENQRAITSLMEDHEEFVTNINNFKTEIHWASQESLFKEMFSLS